MCDLKRSDDEGDEDEKEEGRELLVEICILSLIRQKSIIIQLL